MAVPTREGAAAEVLRDARVAVTLHQGRLPIREVAMTSSTAPVVGRVAGTFRYPVKSMAGESPDVVDVSWHGVAGDRRWAFVRPGQQANGFPWQTLREQPQMCRFTARL